MQALGDKIHSKRIAQEARLNMIPGWVGEVESQEQALQVRTVQMHLD